MSKIIDPKEGYNLYADNYQNDYRKLESFDKGEFLRLLPEKTGTAVDLGIGDGRIAEDLRKISERFIGIDISEKMLIKCLKYHGNIDLVNADLDFSIPLKSNSTDLLTAYFLLVHLKDAKGFIEEVYRVLKENGIFLFNLIHQKKPPVLKAQKKKFKIKSYYHIPAHIEEYLDYFWFKWERIDVFEDKFWVSKIYKAVKV